MFVITENKNKLKILCTVYDNILQKRKAKKKNSRTTI